MSVKSPSAPRRRLAVLCLAAALAGAAAPALGQLAPSYPPSRSLADVAAWLQRETPIQPAQVVDISPQAVTAVTTATPMGETRGFLANISSEAMDPDIVSHDGVTGWTIPVEVDCERREVRLGVMTGYRSRDLRTDPKVVRDADTAWVVPSPTAPLAAVIRALCDRDFHRPLAGRTQLAAKAPGPAKPEASKPAAAKTKPALMPAPPLRTAMLPAPAASAEKAAPPPTAAEPAAHAAAKPKVKPPAGGGSFAVQVGASPSQADAQALLAKVKKKFAAEMGGAGASVATVQLDGKTVNRALITGFASSAEASGFCRMLTAKGQACFVRR